MSSRPRATRSDFSRISFYTALWKTRRGVFCICEEKMCGCRGVAQADMESAPTMQGSAFSTTRQCSAGRKTKTARISQCCDMRAVYYARAIPHNSKCRYGARGAATAKPKAQIILCVLSSILATQMPCRTPSRSEALRSATAACGGSWRGDPPERCLSRQAGIVRCCHKQKKRGRSQRIYRRPRPRFTYADCQKAFVGASIARSCLFVCETSSLKTRCCARLAGDQWSPLHIQ